MKWSSDDIEWQRLVAFVLVSVTLEELQIAFHVTPKESLVALLIASRNTPDEIATLCHNSSHTILRQMEMVFVKLDVTRREQLRSRLLEYIAGRDMDAGTEPVL
jgi:DNA-binding CsgD family transcriptional regulator